MLQYLSMAKYNLRHNLLPHIAMAIVLLMLTPVLFSVKALDSATASYPLELCLPFLGVILLTPVYSPEQESGTLDTVRARKTPHLLICCIRIIIAIALIVIFTCGFTLMMFALECEVTAANALASCANAIFLGGLGILAAAVSGNEIIGYIFPILYYAIDLMGGISCITMFSMMRKGTTDGKLLIFIIGILCIVASVFYWHLRMRRK